MANHEPTGGAHGHGHGGGGASLVAASLVGFLFLGLEQMALEIEQPFGDDPDDLPLEDFCLAIEQSCLDFLERAPTDE